MSGLLADARRRARGQQDFEGFSGCASRSTLACCACACRIAPS
jgi:hypothetical protein